jgi:hypothetical protein
MNQVHVAVLGLLLALGGCATTEVTNTWKNTQDASAPLTRVLVVGISSQASVRRAFEDTFSKSLAEAGVQAVPSYTLVAKDGQIPEDVLQKAVADAGADGVLITRMVKREAELVLTPSPLPPPYFGRRRFYYGYYTGMWAGYYEPTTVQQYRYIVAETTLFRATAPEPAWSATTRSEEPRDVAKSTAGFARAIIPAMKRDGLF